MKRAQPKQDEPGSSKRGRAGKAEAKAETTIAQQQARGILGSNSSYRHHEQVAKPTYNLTENTDGDDAFDDDFQFSTLDIADLLASPTSKTAIEKAGKTFGPALVEIGFAIITGHGIDVELFRRTHAKIEAFFAELTAEQKERYKASRKGSVNQGFFGIAETSNLHPDQVEGWVFCRRAFLLPKGCPERDLLAKFWPNIADELEFREVVAALQTLVKPITRALLAYVGAEPHAFDQKLTNSNFGFRLNYYPPVNPDAAAQGAGRMLAHEDVDLFTLLPAGSQGGLQVLNRSNMKWVRLNAPEGSIIFNAGDYLQRITNDVIPSTTHRVALPLRKHWDRPRTSFPMAVYLNEDVVLEPLKCCGPSKYPSETAIDFHTKITAKYYGDDYREVCGED